MVAGAASSQKRADIIALLLLWSFLTLGSDAVWTFAERIGHGLHLPTASIGVTLSTGTLFGVLNSFVAAFTSGRISKLTALNLVLVGTEVSCLLLGIAPNMIVYAIAVQLYWFFYFFVCSYILGAAAAINPSVRPGRHGGRRLRTLWLRH